MLVSFFSFYSMPTKLFRDMKAYRTDNTLRLMSSVLSLVDD